MINDNTLTTHFFIFKFLTGSSFASKLTCSPTPTTYSEKTISNSFLRWALSKSSLSIILCISYIGLLITFFIYPSKPVLFGMVVIIIPSFFKNFFNDIIAAAVSSKCSTTPIERTISKLPNNSDGGLNISAQ